MCRLLCIVIQAVITIGKNKEGLPFSESRPAFSSHLSTMLTHPFTISSFYWHRPSSPQPATSTSFFWVDIQTQWLVVLLSKRKGYRLGGSRVLCIMYQSGYFSLFYVGSGSHCQLSFFLFVYVSFTTA
jgi:hypothetical protein